MICHFRRRHLNLILAALFGGCFVSAIWTLISFHKVATVVKNDFENCNQIVSKMTLRPPLPQGRSMAQVRKLQNAVLLSLAASCQNLCECFLMKHSNATTATANSNSASQIWKQYMPSLINHFQDQDIGSKVRESDLDVERRITNTTALSTYQHWIQRLYNTVPPFRLKKAWTSSLNPMTLREIYQILQRRYLTPETSPPLTVVVMGGSVTAGHEYYENRAGLHLPQTKPTQNYGWPSRLEGLINQALGFDAINVINMAVSATTSDIGSMILRYQLFPEGVTPDVIIWSFATNDFASNTASQTSVRRQNIQDFLTYAQKLRCGNTSLPAVLMFDDLPLYPGEMNRPLDVSNDIAMLAKWNEAMGISIGPSLLDVALANPSESALHSEWKIERGGFQKSVVNNKRPQGRIHPGLGMHIIMSWVIAYQLLREATEFCSDYNSPYDDATNHHDDQKPQNAVLGDHPPNGPLPPYHTKLVARDVLPLWKSEVLKKGRDCASRRHGQARVMCSYAWVSNRMSKMGTKPHVQQWMDKILVNKPEPNGWSVNGFAGSGQNLVDKVGWEATKINATFTLEHLNSMPEHPIKVITIICMHSYGPKWEHSKVEMKIYKKQADIQDSLPSMTLLSTETMLGYHNSQTSIYYPYQFEIKEPRNSIKPGEILYIDSRLIGGTTFKILGITFCAE